MKIEHNSRCDFYRAPFGAVTLGTGVRLRLGISEGGIPNSVKLVYIGRDKTEKSLNMPYVTEIGSFCVYEVTLPPQTECGNVWYYFEVVTQQGHVFYGNNEKRLGGLGEMYYQKPQSLFQITVYSPDYQTPEWWRNSVCYQIFCDRFANGNEDGAFLGSRDDIIRHNWDDVPLYNEKQFGGKYLSNDFFGGNLKGIEKKLDYLAELGVGAVYLNPIFKAYSNHKYDTGDYMQIDEMFGTEEDFSRLCQKAEEHGIKIVLDGVFNHTGSDSRYFNKEGRYDSLGAYQSQDSPYYDWYTFSHWNDVYESWWGMLTLPQANKKCESYRDYILRNEDSVVKHWLKAGASGWRLDVVDELPGFFVKTLRREVKKQNPDAVIIGEVWEDASNKCSYGEEREYFLGGEKLSDLEAFHPERMASRILGMGDVLTLIDKAQENFNEKEAAELEDKIRQQTFDLGDFLGQLQQIKKMGPISQLIGMMPGVDKKMMDSIDAADSEKRLKRIEAIIQSMTEVILGGLPSILTQ